MIKTVKLLALLLILALMFTGGCVQKTQELDSEINGRIAKIAIGPGVVHLDAQDTNTRYAFEVTQFSYENLFERDEDGKLVPWLVEDLKVSDDGLVYSLVIRNGVKFHDGTPLDAEAVKVNLQRKIESDRPLADMLKPYLEKMEVSDPMILELHFNKPMFDLPGILAAKTFAIYSPKAINENEDQWLKENMVGTGPFVLKEYRRDEYARFEKNSDYWIEGAPYVDAIEIIVVAESSTRAAMLESGEIDAAIRLSSVDYKRYMDNSNQGIKVVSMPVAEQTFVLLNNLKEGLDYKLVRQALNYGVNREMIKERVFMGIGRENANTSLISSVEEHFVVAGNYNYNPEKAKKLLEQSGWKIENDGWRYKNNKQLKFNLWASELDTGETQSAEIIKENLRQIGVNVELQLIDAATARAKCTVPPEECEYDMVMWSMGGYTGYIDFKVNTFMHSDAWPPKYYNRSYYKNETVDMLIDEGNLETTEEGRYEKFKQAIEIVTEDAPVIQLHEVSQMVAMRQNVEGIYIEPSAIIHPAKFIKFTD